MGKTIDHFNDKWVFSETHSYNGEPCWDWTAATITSGYGSFAGDTNSSSAHRWSYEHFLGPIPEKVQVGHLCKNKICVNPGHLELLLVGKADERSERSALRRFHKRCKASSEHFHDGEPCWEWLGDKFLTAGKHHRHAHRWAYKHFVGDVPDGLSVKRTCGTVLCVNPAHLELAIPGNSHRDKTHCIHGHEFTPENTYENKGSRYCRTCLRRRQRECVARKKAKQK